MIKINLLDNLIDPLVVKPSKEKIQQHWQDQIIPTKIVDPHAEGTIQKIGVKKHKITWCSCKKHPVNPHKDIYNQHNHWLRQQLGGPVETLNSQIDNATPIGVSIKKFELTYDFSGEDFEMSPEELRKIKDGQEK